MNKPASAFFAGAVLVLGSTNTKAEQPGCGLDAGRTSQAKGHAVWLHARKQVEAYDGRWEGEGTKDGRKMEFHADPKTGQITHEKLATDGRRPI